MTKQPEQVKRTSPRDLLQQYEELCQLRAKVEKLAARRAETGERRRAQFPYRYVNSKAFSSIRKSSICLPA